MIQTNPFAKAFDHLKDEELVNDALKGNRKALNQLVRRHNPFIYNISLKMLGNPADAQDATQDILVKVITNLAKYDKGKAQFRTWLYRITFNFILNFKKSISEKKILSFEQFFEFIEGVEDDTSITYEEGGPLNPVSEEAKLKCMSGMPMCVAREDRLLYIVGDLFEIDHNLGAEIFQISKANFRKKLSRIRNSLRQWMNNKCGLVNKSNPCRCERKTKGFIERGIVDPENLVWDKGFSSRIEDYTVTNLNKALIVSDKIYSSLYQKHPLKESISAEKIIDEILSDGTMSEILKF